MNNKMAECARINFENFERAFPLALKHPYYRIAKAQLDESLGGKTVEESLGPVKEIGSIEFKEDGTVIISGCIESVTEIESE